MGFSEEKTRGPRAWALFLAVNSLLLVGSVGLLAARVFHHLTAPEIITAARPPKPAPPPAAKSESKPEPKPEADKKAAAESEAPKKVEKPTVPAEPELKKPLPKPSLAASPAPARKSAEPLLGSALVSPIKGDPERVTRPVSFLHEEGDAKSVELLGMFLVRTGGRQRMFKDSQGVWRSTIYLKTDQTYDYKFEIIDAKGNKRVSSSQSISVPK